MKSLKKLYLHNSIFRFMVSYSGVLLVPLLVCLLSYQFAFNTVKDEIQQNNLSTLTHSKNLIDEQLSTIHSLIMQTADNSTIIALTNKELSAGFYADASKAISEMAYIFKYANTDLLEDVYLYIDKTDYILTRYDLYQPELYYKMVLKEDIDYKSWMNELKNQLSYQKYVVSDNKIKIIEKVPFGLNKPFQGSIVCSINKQKLRNYFNNIDIENGSTLFISDKEGQILLSLSNQEIEMPNILEENMNKTTFTQKINGVNSTIFLLKSAKTGWYYTLMIPENVIMHRLTNLKVIISSLFILAITVGILVSYYMANRNGKPIEDIKRQLINMDDDIELEEIVSTSSLSETLAKVMSQKRILVDEIEKQKPYLESVLFQKLIKGEFTNEKELSYICQKTQVNLEANTYWIINCRFFGNNDMFNLDEQTLEDVNLLKILLKEIIQEVITEKMFFYDLDQLTITIILPKIDISYNSLKESIDKINDMMKKEYKVVPYWGISNECSNLLQLWRAFEESKSALKSGIQKGENNFIEYNTMEEDETIYYYPQVLEKQLMTYTKEGNSEGIKKLLDIVYIENFEKRSLSESKIDKLYIGIKGTIFKLTKKDDTQSYINSIESYMIEKTSDKVKECFKVIKDTYLQISASYSEDKKAQQNKLIDRMISYINVEYVNPSLGLGMIATKFNISEGYVSSLFKEQAGINFAEYVENQRISEACNLLETTSLSINDISETVGYNSVQSFRRAFKRLHGFSPSELRKK